MENKDFNIKNGILKRYHGNEFHVVIPNSVNRIGDGAFNGCVNLTSIKIPKSVISIGNFAFRNCKNLKNIKIPNSVIEIECGAFEGCTSLVSINIPNSIMRICAWAFNNCTNLNSINIPNSVTSIGMFAFSGCNGLTNIKIPNYVTYIDYKVFYDCTSLTSIEIPNSVMQIDALAFKNCTSLKSIKMSNIADTIGKGAFEGINKVKPQYNKNGALRAFKGFNKDWACREFKYEVGKSYHQDGKIECCENGFHACTNPLDVFNYYNGHLDELRFAEVELSGEMDFDDEDSKVAASDIRIIRELTVQELFDIYNKMEKENENLCIK